jgi:uncharacterized membrane protein YfcA
MHLIEAVEIVAAGLTAGALNAVVGSGTLVTFPVLLALGYPPVIANASNTVGLVPGSFSGAYGYRAELVGQRSRLLRLSGVSLAGGATGAALLLLLPPTAFRTVVPALICVAVVLVAIQPWLARRVRQRRISGDPGRRARSRLTGTALLLGVYGTGVYGGYFGAAQGVLQLGLFGVLTAEPLQRLNGIKNVLTGVVNAVAAAVFVATAHVAWPPALLIAGGSVVGGLLGGRFGRRLPNGVLRGVIMAVGLTAIVAMTIG